MGNTAASAAPSAAGAPPTRPKPVLHPRYQVRVVLAGERSTGKTALASMLAGASFSEVYEPTAAPRASYVEWLYKSTNEQVGLELVEVPVPGARKPASQELKLAFDAPEPRAPAGGEDAVADVVGEAHAVVLVFDPSKLWTLDYVKKELERLQDAEHLDVLVLANFRDKADEWQVSSDEVRDYARALRNVRFLECSAKDGFGKTQILTFFNLPFLRQQRQHLDALLARNVEDTEIAQQEFDMVSFEQNYGAHLTWATTAPTARAAPAPVVAAASPVPAVKSAAPAAAKAAPAAVASAGALPTVPQARRPVVAEEDLDGFLVDDGDDGWGKTILSDDEDSSSGNELVHAPRLEAPPTTKTKVAPAKQSPTAKDAPRAVVADVPVAKDAPKAVVADVPVAKDAPKAVAKDTPVATAKAIAQQTPVAQVDPSSHAATTAASVKEVRQSAHAAPASPRRVAAPLAVPAPAPVLEDDDEDLDGFLGASTALPDEGTTTLEAVSLEAVPVPVVIAPVPVKPSDETLASVLEAARALAEQQAKESAAKPARAVKAKKKKRSKTSAPAEAPAPSRRGDYTEI